VAAGWWLEKHSSTGAARNVFEHLAGAEDFEVAEATYRAAVKRPVITRDRQDGV
jgi:hypothetical protein